MADYRSIKRALLARVPSPRGRGARLTAAAVAVLAVAYALGAFLVMPYVIASALERDESLSGGPTVRVARVFVNPLTLAVELTGLAIDRPAAGISLLVDRVTFDFDFRTLLGRTYVIDALAADAPRLRLRPADDEAVPPRLPNPLALVPPEAAYGIERLTVADGRIEVLGPAAADDPRIVLGGIAVSASGISSDGPAAGAFRLSIDDAVGGTLRAEGEISPHDGTSRGRIAIAGVDVAILQEWLGFDRVAAAAATVEAEYGLAGAGPERSLRLDEIALHLRDPRLDLGAYGAVGASALDLGGRAVFRPAGSSAEVRIGLDSAAIRGEGDDEPWLGAKRLTAEGVTIAGAEGAPVQVSIDALRLAAPRTTIAVRGPPGPFAAVLSRLWGPPAADALEDVRAALGRIEIEDGTLTLADESDGSRVTVPATAVNGTIARVEGRPGEIAVDVDARLGESGSGLLVARAALGEGARSRDVRLELEGVDAALFAPYVERATGRAVTAGSVDAAVEYRVQDGAMNGSARIGASNLELARVPGKPGGPPLDFAVALLEDERGRLDVAVPLEGGRGVADALARGLLSRLEAVAARPFDALGELVGLRGDALREIPFEPGQAAPSPAGAEAVAALGRALDRRPGIGLRVAGIADREIDRDALAAQQIELHVALATAGPTLVARPEPVDFTSPRDRDILDEFAEERLSDERLETIRSYFTRGPDGDVVDAEETSYYEALFDELVENEPIPENGLERLARYRAQAVADVLVDQGVAADRIELADPRLTRASARRAPAAAEPSRASGAAVAASEPSSVGMPLELFALPSISDDPADAGGRAR